MDTIIFPRLRRAQLGSIGDRRYYEIAESLLQKYRQQASTCTEEQLCAISPNIARNVLEHSREDVEGLFTETASAKPLLLQVQDPFQHTNSQSFYSVIIGSSDWTTCAKLFFTFLASTIHTEDIMSHSYRLDKIPRRAPSIISSIRWLLWCDFLGELGWLGWSCNNQDPIENTWFRDLNLPLPKWVYQSVFKLRVLPIRTPNHFNLHYQDFYSRQQEFNPVNIIGQFDSKRDKLRHILHKESVICQELDCEGRDVDPHADHRFIPHIVVGDIVNKSQELIRMLFVEGRKAYRDPLESADAWAVLKSVERGLSQLADTLKPRAQILLTLVEINVSPTSEAWRNFDDSCTRESPRLQPLKGCPLSDKSLPLSFAQAEYYFKLDAGLFWSQQFLFCAVKLSHREQITLPKSSDWENAELLELAKMTRLPLLKKQKLGRGSYGTVFRVTIKSGYYKEKNLPDHDRELAMKELASTLKNSREWRFAKWLFRQRMDHKNILRATASLKTPEKIYIFFPCAQSDLKAHFEQNNTGPGTDEERIKYLNSFYGIVDAIWYLHKHLHAESQWKKMICVHQDLKAENVLVSHNDDELLFQITDFGISHVAQEPKVDKSNMSVHDLAPHSLRNITATAQMGDNLPNAPPESRTGRIDSAADIWALGVLYLEFLAWIHGGMEELENFANWRGHGRGEPAGVDGDTEEWHLSYTAGVDPYRPGNKIAVIKPGISTWYNKSLIRGTSSDKMRNIYSQSQGLVLCSMLECDPHKRAKIEQVRDTFRFILDLANS